LKDELASETTLARASVLATKIFALKDRSQFKKKSAKSKRAGQAVQKIILDTATSLSDNDRNLISAWFPETAADTIIRRSKTKMSLCPLPSEVVPKVMLSMRSRKGLGRSDHVPVKLNVLRAAMRMMQAKTES
jgi:hypothetical protein